MSKFISFIMTYQLYKRKKKHFVRVSYYGKGLRDQTLNFERYN